MVNFYRYSSLLELPLNHLNVSRIFRIVQLQIIIPLIPCIISRASGAADIVNQEVLEIGIILYLYVYVILAILAMYAGVKRYTIHYCGGITQFQASAASLPCL